VLFVFIHFFFFLQLRAKEKNLLEPLSFHSAFVYLLSIIVLNRLEHVKHIDMLLSCNAMPDMLIT